MIRLVCVAIGYVFGLFQTAYILGRMEGIDIRNYGSGNSGTTNMLRTKGLKSGLMTLAGDVIKCILAVVLVSFLFGEKYPEIRMLLKFYAAAGVIIGHNFPFYLGFKGGKGIAATAGFILSLGPVYTIVGVILFFGTFFTTHYVSLGSLLVYAGLVIQTIVMGQLGFLHMDQMHLYETYIVVFLLAVMAYYKHRENIVRLLNHQERKTYLRKKSDQ